MTFRLQCVTTSLSTVGALFAATLRPSLTAFTLSVGQALAYVVAAGVASTSCAASTGASGCAAPAPSTSSSRLPPSPRRWALFWLIHTLLPDLGENRGLRGSVGGAVVLAVAGIIELAVDLGVWRTPSGSGRSVRRSNRSREGSDVAEPLAPTMGAHPLQGC